MKRALLFILLLLPGAFAPAQGVSYLTVTDEAQYQDTGDFTNTFEIQIFQAGSKEAAKCQAVRIAKEWYITAAHCVAACAQGCSVVARLAVTPQYEMRALVTNTARRPRVFLHPGYNPGVKTAKNDMALLYFPPRAAEYYFLAGRRAISEEVFLKIIPDYNIYYKANHGANLPAILELNPKTSRLLNRQISAVSIWDGRREVLPATKPLIYNAPLGVFLGENFGIKQGISGSGLMTNTGELAAIVSAMADLEVKSGKGDGGKNVRVIFAVPFDDAAVKFIKAHAPHAQIKEAGPAMLSAVPAQYTYLGQKF
ncbi:MAG: trypsin-like serine protease [Elusimicrobiota bacterium]|jgi:hypothetical protein|nr:trypsin-like serine protease [Elusimicrobiota bacterium]